MPQAPTYQRSTGFAEQERNNAGGRTTVRADRLDAELDAAGQSINTLRANQALIQRDDGQLKDRIVSPQALRADTVAMLGGSKFTPRGAWAAGAIYASLDLVERDSTSFVCLVPHTSGDGFDADRAAGLWQLFPGQPIAENTGFTPTADVPQATVQAAVEHIASDMRRRTAAELAYYFGAL